MCSPLNPGYGLLTAPSRRPSHPLLQSKKLGQGELPKVTELGSRSSGGWTPSLEDSESSAQAPHGPPPSTQYPIQAWALHFLPSWFSALILVWRPLAQSSAWAELRLRGERWCLAAALCTVASWVPQRGCPQATPSGPNTAENVMKQPPDMLRSVPGRMLKAHNVTSDLYR